MKTALAQVYRCAVISNQKFSRGPTDSNPPSAPTLLIPAATLTTIIMGWTNGTDAETGILDTQVEWSLSGQNSWTTALVPYRNGGGVSYTITGLTSGMAYDLRAKNHDNANNASAYSAIRTVSTLSSASDLAPGTISISATSITASEGGTFSVALTRSGAGISSPIVEADWAFSGFTQGTPSPANGTIQWPAGQNGPLTFQATAGAVSGNVTGLLSIVAVRALSGSIQPTLGTAQANLTILESQSGVVTWNPGYYGLTNNITFPDDRHLSQQITEQNVIIGGGPNVMGLKMLYQPGCFGNSFDFSKIFRDLNKLRAAGKRIMITLIPQEFGSGSYADLLPPNVYSSSVYGASPTASRYGWWSMDGNTGRTIAYWRPAVMDWVISMFQALATTVNPTTGLTLDQDPFVEQLAWGETSMGIDAGSDYTPAAMVVQYKRLIDAVRIAFPHKVFMVNNNFAGSEALSQDLTNYTKAAGAAQGGPDTYALGQRGTNPLTWGQKAALGNAQPSPVDSHFTGSDLRGLIGMQSDTQGPEISIASRYTMYTPHSFYTMVNDVLKQSHMVITMIATGATDDPVPAYPRDGVNSGANPGNWHSFLQVINGSPLTHIAKPSSIP